MKRSDTDPAWLMFRFPKREKIVRNVVEQTLAYALCRKLTRNDQAVVDSITKNLCENNGTWRSLFQQIANSVLFRETLIKAIKK